MLTTIVGPVDKWYPLGQRRGKNKDKDEITGDVHLVFKYKELQKNDQKEEKKHGMHYISSPSLTRSPLLCPSLSLLF